VIVDEIIPTPEGEVDFITVEPSTEHVWIPGYWERDPDKWTWVKGRWEKPPLKKAHWQNGHWKWQEGKWHWVRGYWSVTPEGRGLIVDEIIEVPVALTETKPPKPSDKHRWLSGYWEWNGHWFWVPGYWTAKVKPEAEWVVGLWAKYGTKGYRWISGHWKVK
jgi:hypothetical protein